MAGAEWYAIWVEGRLPEGWSAWFEGMEVRAEDGRSVLVGPVADQAALHGVLAKVRDLNLVLVGVRRVEGRTQDLQDVQN